MENDHRRQRRSSCAACDPETASSTWTPVARQPPTVTQQIWKPVGPLTLKAYTFKSDSDLLSQHRHMGNASPSPSRIGMVRSKTTSRLMVPSQSVDAQSGSNSKHQKSASLSSLSSPSVSSSSSSSSLAVSTRIRSASLIQGPADATHRPSRAVYSVTMQRSLSVGNIKSKLPVRIRSNTLTQSQENHTLSENQTTSTESIVLNSETKIGWDGAHGIKSDLMTEDLNRDDEKAEDCEHVANVLFSGCTVETENGHVLSQVETPPEKIDAIDCLNDAHNPTSVHNRTDKVALPQLEHIEAIHQSEAACNVAYLEEMKASAETGDDFSIENENSNSDSPSNESTPVITDKMENAPDMSDITIEQVAEDASNHENISSSKESENEHCTSEIANSSPTFTMEDLGNNHLISDNMTEKKSIESASINQSRILEGEDKKIIAESESNPHIPIDDPQKLEAEVDAGLANTSTCTTSASHQEAIDSDLHSNLSDAHSIREEEESDGAFYFDDASTSYSTTTSLRNFKITPRRRRQIDMKDLTGLATLIQSRHRELQDFHRQLQSNAFNNVIKKQYISTARDIVMLGKGIAMTWRPLARSCSDKVLSELLLMCLSKCETFAAHMKVIVSLKAAAEGIEGKDGEGLVLSCAVNLVDATSEALDALKSAELRFDDL